MPEMHLARGFVPRRSVFLFALAITALMFAACDDSDAAHTGPAGSTGGGAGGAPSGGAASAGASGAGVAGNADETQSDAGAGGALTGDAGASGAEAGAAGAAGEPGHVSSCASGGALFVSSSYESSTGERLLLRAGAKAATFALLARGAPTPALPPRLYLVDRVCAPGGALIAHDERSSYRLDFMQAGSRFSACLSAPVASLEAALALQPAAPSHASDTGCAGKPFTVYTAEAP